MACKEQIGLMVAMLGVYAMHARLPDIAAIYSTTDPDEAITLLRRYNVEYVYVGSRERRRYPAKGLAKFDAMFPIVFQHGSVVIYRVR